MTYDDLANRLAADYSIFLFALAGRYQSIRAPGLEITPRVVSDLRSDVSKMGSSFVESATQALARYAFAYAPELESDASRRSIVLRKKEAIARVRGIVAENIHQVVRMTITGVGGVGTLLRDAHGATGLLVQRSFSNIEFRVTDSASRKWPAEKFFKVVVRDFAYQSWIDAQADGFIASGNDLMQTSKGDVFSLLGTRGYPTFDEIRVTAFHPNSTSDMVPYVPS